MLPTRFPVVLLADDDPIRKYLRYVLERDDYEIIECAGDAVKCGSLSGVLINELPSVGVKKH